MAYLRLLECVPESGFWPDLARTGNCCAAHLPQVNSAARNSRSFDLGAKSTFRNALLDTGADVERILAALAVKEYEKSRLALEDFGHSRPAAYGFLTLDDMDSFLLERAEGGVRCIRKIGAVGKDDGGGPVGKQVEP